MCERVFRQNLDLFSKYFLWNLPTLWVDGNRMQQQQQQYKSRGFHFKYCMSRVTQILWGPWQFCSSSSSPLLSLVTSTSEISHQPVHTYTTYIWQRGRQNRKTGNGRKVQHLHEEREEKIFFYPQTMLHWEYSVRTEKKLCFKKKWKLCFIFFYISIWNYVKNV